MEHRYKILPEKALLLQFFSNKVSLEDLVKALEHVIRTPLYKPNYNGLTIIMDAEVELSATSIKHYSGWFKKMIKSSEGLGKLALMVDKPSHTALSQIFQFELKDFKEIQVFNTYDGALGWLGLDGSNILDEITELKKTEPFLY